ncbi:MULTISPECIES: hypothetical protein [Rhodococcus]|uniref:hypothetical protein n=1 Tax=Rhodococcus TaxID=1827 RepID=UPI0029551F04|nr:MULTISPECIES: hypothetical protein [Rhodococcus]MDV7091170.1 hypothetical protein [Rhodococcus opacus]MDV7246379.1 hypothetical protein [Rhodococcus oxybenzonivorans]MDV7337339.1 hypothetical protein [Rhodococcus oxybenzonivorans]MDV7348041.1 hypothetical protein [Rhodococcus oxybenzonivorans]MDV8031622.1 hypothetical protein [Rhodococcus sp. IEGM 27]
MQPASPARSAVAELRELKLGSIDLNFDGTRICIYATHFEVIPANRRCYNISVNNFGAAVLHI